MGVRGSGLGNSTQINAEESMKPVNETCFHHLCMVIERLDPELLIGVGSHAGKQLAVEAEELDRRATLARSRLPGCKSGLAGNGLEAALNLGLWTK